MQILYITQVLARVDVGFYTLCTYIQHLKCRRINIRVNNNHTGLSGLDDLLQQYASFEELSVIEYGFFRSGFSFIQAAKDFLQLLIRIFLVSYQTQLRMFYYL